MSESEEAYANLTRIFGLPPAEREYRFCPDRMWRFDFAYVEQRVAVECDGGQWVARGGRHNRDADREKLNTAAALGWRVLRFSPEMLESDGAGCIAQVRKALGGVSDRA